MRGAVVLMGPAQTAAAMADFPVSVPPLLGSWIICLVSYCPACLMALCFSFFLTEILETTPSLTQDRGGCLHGFPSLLHSVELF